MLPCSHPHATAGLSNIGPCGSSAVGLPDGLDLSEVRSVRQYDMVLASGHGKNGSVSILHRSFQPNILMATDAVSNCIAQWAVYAPDAPGMSAPAADKTHSYLLLSQDRESLVGRLQVAAAAACQTHAGCGLPLPRRMPPRLRVPSVAYLFAHCLPAHVPVSVACRRYWGRRARSCPSWRTPSSVPTPAPSSPATWPDTASSCRCE